MQKKSSSEILSRIFAAYGIAETRGALTLLAEKMETSQGTISGWKNRGVPNDVLARVAEETGASLDWLHTGNGEMHPAKKNLLPTNEDARWKFIARKWEDLSEDKRLRVAGFVAQLSEEDN